MDTADSRAWAFLLSKIMQKRRSCMARKLQLVSQLADQTARDITRDVDGWKKYLDSASRLYKYKFEDQLLIYAQRPDATACAAMGLWNEKMHRWVKAGSKGIALIRENENGRPRLQYVFDVSDTRPVRGARMPYLWEMREEHHPAVLATLEKQYGKSDRQEFGSCLMEAAARAVKEAYPEYLRDLAYDAEGSFLEGLDDLNREVCFRDTLTASVQYALLTRCGLNASDHLEDDGLRGIMEFSTPAVLHHLGDATSTLSMGILQEIGRTIRNFDREMIQSRQKNAEKPLEKPADIGYTKGTEEFNALKHKSKERSIENGRTDIQEERGLSDTGSDDGRGGRGRGDHVREVRTFETEFPEGTPPRNLHLQTADREADGTSAGDGQAGTGTGRPDGSRDDETERSGRSAEGTRSDGVVTGSEQLHGAGGGSGASGDRLSVNPEETGQETKEKQPDKEEQETAGEEPAVSASGEKEPAESNFFQISLFPTVEEQVGHIVQAQADEKQAKKTAVNQPVLPQVPDAVIGRALTSGGNEKNSLLRIIAFYQIGPDEKTAADFLAQEYRTGGKGLTVGGRDYAMWFDENGIRIAPGRTANIPGATSVPWEKAAALVAELLENGTYAVQETLDAARMNEYKELAAKLWYLRQDLSEVGKEAGVLPYLSELYHEFPGFPDSTDKIAECLGNAETRKRLLDEITVFAKEYSQNPELLRFHRIHDPELLSLRIESMSIVPKDFHAIEGYEPARASFITEDEIDRMLTRGSGISEGKMRIYSYFVQGHDAKERADFLRDEYGTGGHGHIGYDEWHDRKGIRFTRGDDISGYEGYDKVQLSWDKVQKRIGKLINEGKYLNSKEMAYTAQYERVQLARNIVTFYSCAPNRQTDISPYDQSYSQAEKQILQALGNPEKSAKMYEDMVKRSALVSPDERNYHLMQRAMDDMGAYQRGGYSLFTPLPEEILKAQRQKKDAPKKAAPPKEQKPIDELEAAARALAKKQRQKAKEGADGQLSFDFSVGTEEMETPPDIQGQAEEFLRRDEEEAILSQYDLGYGFLGNGLTVWNRLEEVNGDYKTVAHIDSDRSVTFRDENLPDIIKERIEQIASTAELNISATQDVPVFSAPPEEVPELAEDKKTEEHADGQPEKVLEAQPLGKTPADLYRETLTTLVGAIRQSSFYDYLRDRETDYDNAAAELDQELSYFIEEIAASQPELYEAFYSLPHFREWMVEDILQRTYDDVLIDSRDALSRHAEEKDFPEWAGEAAAPEQMEAGRPEPEAAEATESTQTGDQFLDREPPEIVEIEGGTIDEDGPLLFTSPRLPYDIVVEKLHIGPERSNFHITDDGLGTGGQKTKYQNNMAAIRTLKQIEAENRLATPQEQEILSNYVGWGGLAQAFDPDNEKWGKEHAGLKELLTPEEYASAQSTVLNAHYTSPVVIKAMYEAVSRMDFTPGNILEPSCGIGNFFGLVPEGFQNANLYGVELDPLTGRIARQLYQKADIAISGFEDSEHPDDFFDLAVGNGSVLFRLNAENTDFMRVCECLAYKLAA